MRLLAWTKRGIGCKKIKVQLHAIIASSLVIILNERKKVLYHSCKSLSSWFELCLPLASLFPFSPPLTAASLPTEMLTCWSTGIDAVLAEPEPEPEPFSEIKQH